MKVYVRKLFFFITAPCRPARGACGPAEGVLGARGSRPRKRGVAAEPRRDSGQGRQGTVLRRSVPQGEALGAPSAPWHIVYTLGTPTWYALRCFCACCAALSRPRELSGPHVACAFSLLSLARALPSRNEKKQVGKRCDPRELEFANTCEALMAHFPCEGGCGHQIGDEIPAYVADRFGNRTLMSKEWPAHSRAASLVPTA